MFKKFINKKFTSSFIALMMTFSIITPFNVFAMENQNTKIKDLTKDITTIEKTTKCNSVNLQILATSDIHGRFVPYDYAVNEANQQGSLTQILTAVRKFRENNPNNTILVDAGDTIQDNSASLFINDEKNPMMVAMNEIGYDAVTLGNHEFNYGVPVLEKVMKQFKAIDGKDDSILGGNVYKPDGSRLAAPYKIVTTKDGVKVGLIGMVTPNITRWDSANLKEYKVTNPVDETKKVITEIKDKVDVMIAVDHMGEDSEYGVKGSGVKDLAEECPELTAIVCGHAHSKIPGDYYYNGKIYNGKDVADEIKCKGTLIVEPYKWARSLSQININLTKKDGKYVVENKAKDISSQIYDMAGKNGKPVNFQEDKELSKKLQPYNERAIKEASEIVGELKGGDLVKADEVKGIPTCQIEETPMIDLINRVQMLYGEKMCNHKIDVASCAAFRSSANIKEGKIRKCDISLIYKFDNTIYVFKITGKQLKQYMECSAKYYNQYKDGDLTISFNPDIRGYNYDMFSGVNYKIDISKPAGNRIIDLNKNGKPIKDNDVLYMTVNDYRGKSHLLKYGAVFKEGEKLPELICNSGDPKFGLGDGRIRDLIGEYIIDKKGGIITPEKDNNWSITGNNWDESKRQLAVKLINEGKINVPVSKNGRTPNVKAVTWNDIVKYGYGIEEKPSQPVKPNVKPTKPQVKPNNPKGLIYVVKKGDTLNKIGKKYHMTYKKIAKYNNIKNPNMIFINQKIIIPAN